MLLTRLFDKTSVEGNRYFVGRLGAARLLMMLDRDAPVGTDSVWRVFISAIEDRPAATDKPADPPATKPLEAKATKNKADASTSAIRPHLSRRHPDARPDPALNDGVGDVWRGE